MHTSKPVPNVGQDVSRVSLSSMLRLRAWLWLDVSVSASGADFILALRSQRRLLEVFYSVCGIAHRGITVTKPSQLAPIDINWTAFP